MVRPLNASPLAGAPGTAMGLFTPVRALRTARPGDRALVSATTAAWAIGCRPGDLLTYE